MSDQTLIAMMQMRARDRPGAPALYGRVDDGWRQLSWEQWWQASRQAAKGLISLGVQPGDSVVLVSIARAEWAVAHPAICACGGVPVPVHPDTPAAMLAKILAVSGAKVAIVDGADRLEQILLHRTDPGVVLDHVVTLDRFRNRGDRVIDLDDLMERGASIPAAPLEARIAELTEDTPVIQVFSGDSDGPWLSTSHGEFVRLSRQKLVALGQGPCVVFNSVAPVSATILVATLGFAAASGGELWFTPDARGLTDARPHVALLDPAQWARVAQILDTVANDTSGWRGGLMTWSRMQARSPNQGWTSAIARTVLHPVLEICGLLETVGYSEAPLDEALRADLASLGVEIRPL